MLRLSLCGSLGVERRFSDEAQVMVPFVVDPTFLGGPKVDDVQPFAH